MGYKVLNTLMKCKIVKLLLINLYNTFYSEKTMFALLLPLCLKLPVIAAIIRHQQVERIIKNNHKNTILYANILFEVH